MSDEAMAAALPGRPEYTVKKYIQLVEALRDKAAALTASSGEHGLKADAETTYKECRGCCGWLMQLQHAVHLKLRALLCQCCRNKPAAWM